MLADRGGNFDAHSRCSKGVDAVNSCSCNSHELSESSLRAKPCSDPIHVLVRLG